MINALKERSYDCTCPSCPHPIKYGIAILITITSIALLTLSLLNHFEVINCFNTEAQWALFATGAISFLVLAMCSYCKLGSRCSSHFPCKKPAEPSKNPAEPPLKKPFVPPLNRPTRVQGGHFNYQVFKDRCGDEIALAIARGRNSTGVELEWGCPEGEDRYETTLRSINDIIRELMVEFEQSHHVELHFGGREGGSGVTIAPLGTRRAAGINPLDMRFAGDTGSDDD